MADRPIIFSGHMVRALLDGRKTQTRRAIKPQPDSVGDKIDAVLKYRIRDRLWVRETCRAVEHEDGTDAVEYLADASCARIENTAQSADNWGALYHYGKRGPDRRNREGRKVPPIHMPRWASRLTLIVTDVRVHRLQEISEADARAEGAPVWWRYLPEDQRAPTTTATGMFRNLWNSLHGPDAWGENPWVCALTFTAHRCNIDQMEARQ